ncbi:hypothetical protein CDD81_1550 [Ophiocordyceps australis]|uniref:Rhodopsin domain-containing protein n=1 Tax=Ophiocordyceps australis TaxID=1399860 RepID=A0A2C5XTE3_9HYPO|nr:hypothetical protein CDD81_1550 [Ophiocordyceps australis]
MDPKVAEAFASGRLPNADAPDVTPQFLNESRDKPAIIGILFVTGLTATIVVGRLLSRAFVVRRFGFDDGLALISLIVFATFVGLCIELIRLGSGRHFDYIKYVLDVPTVQRTQVLDFAAHIVYSTALLLCRVSGLAFYWRVCGLHHGFHLAIRGVFVILVAAYLPQLLLVVFHCRPVTGLWPYGWEPGTEKYTCLQWGLVYVVISTISLFCDLLLFGIPVAMLKILEMPRRRKIQLGCILLPGIAVIVISITRLAFVIVGQWQSDMSWSYNAMLGVEVSEIGATLIALSIPGFKPLVDRFILHKDPESQHGASRYNMRGVAGTPGGTALSTLKLRSQYSMLDADGLGSPGSAKSSSAGSHHVQPFVPETGRTKGGARVTDTEVSAGTHGSVVSQEGIHVTVDVHVKDDDLLEAGRAKYGRA